MAVGNLEFIKSASGTSVSSLSVTDCFSADYDVYYLSASKINDSGTVGGDFRLIDSGGSVISASEYDYASRVLLANTAFAENKGTNLTEIQNFSALGAGNNEGLGISAYIYNPYDSSSYTFVLYQTASFVGSQFRGYKGIGVHKVAEQITGVNLGYGANTDEITLKIFGVK